MALKTLPQEQVEQGQRDLRKQFLAGSVVSTLNMSAIAALAGNRKFEYPKGSGKWYHIPKIPYSDGVVISNLYTRILEIAETRKTAPSMSSAVYERILKELLDVAWKLSVPKAKLLRLRKFLGSVRNPFYEMSEGDTGELIGFFLMLRMTSNVGFSQPEHKRSPSQQTSSIS